MITNLPSRNNPRIAAFSLVEVVLALSIMGFVCVTLLGLMATGLGNVQKSTTTTVNAQIIQTVINTLEVHAYTNSLTPMYFDDEGTALTGTTGLYTATIVSTNAYSGANADGSIYNTNNATRLLVQVVSKASPSVTNTFSLIYPNTGN